LKPFVGPGGNGPGDAAVITPVSGSSRGLAIGSGLATGWCEDPYLMVLAAVDECIRNLVCVGADPERIAILDNYCWPSCEDPQRMAELVRASVGCLHAGLAYRTPFISGKDSLNNQFTTDAGETIRIPPTMLISGFGIVPDVGSCVSMDAKHAEHALLLVGDTSAAIGGSHLLFVAPDAVGDRSLPVTDLQAGPARARAVASVIAEQLVYAAHDCSEGGVLLQLKWQWPVGLESILTTMRLLAIFPWWRPSLQRHPRDTYWKSAQIVLTRFEIGWRRTQSHRLGRLLSSRVWFLVS
jgi:phosphoribosylformylglycinamidine (FGAM) synthase-like enzyme